MRLADAGSGQLNYLVSACAKRLAGLPPAFIPVGVLNLLVDQDLDYAARLGRAGVPVELPVHSGAFEDSTSYPETRLIASRQHDIEKELEWSAV